MAELVGAIATSHSPMLLTAPKLWQARAEQDRDNPELFDGGGRRVAYDTLLEASAGRFERELAPEVVDRRYRLCQRSLDRLAADVCELDPDVLVVIGDDQAELFDASNQPAVAMFWGESWRTGHMHGVPDNEFFSIVKEGYAMDREQLFAGSPHLGLSVISSLVSAGFDVASVAGTPPGRGFGHAYGFIVKRLVGDRPVKVLPVMLNTYYPPNQPTPARCLALGAAIGKAVDEAPSDQRVLLVASGGLSHFVIDEALDGRVLDAIRAGDGDDLESIPPELLNAGSSEIRNWITVAGAMAPRAVAWSEYVPCYRTPAGTGCAMGFLRWA